MPRKSSFLKPIKHGALHRQLGIPLSKRIPIGLEREILEAKIGNKVLGHKVTPLMKKRVNFAVNMRKCK
jgi:hypothetical protein